VGVQVCLQINGKSGVARDMISLHLEGEVNENEIACTERIWGTKPKLDEFDDMATDGGQSEGEGKGQPPSEEAWKGKRT
jgi:hypothetical protein